MEYKLEGIVVSPVHISSADVRRKIENKIKRIEEIKGTLYKMTKDEKTKNIITSIIDNDIKRLR
ncbi:MAG: hypothetical protein ACP5G1_03135, partial [Nanopusillaceae archaeon]